MADMSVHRADVAGDVQEAAPVYELVGVVNYGAGGVHAHKTRRNVHTHMEMHGRRIWTLHCHSAAQRQVEPHQR